MKHLKLDNLILDAGEIINYESFTFNGGEEYIRITDNINFYDEILIEVSLASSLKVMQLLLTTDALRRLGCYDISLFCPYFPYARQDRVCNEGESLSLKVMTDLINSQEYESVYVLDPHSNVTTGLLNECEQIDTFGIICEAFGISSLQWKDSVLISPDAGSLKKSYSLAKKINSIEVVSCDKERDVMSGEVKRTIVHCDDLTGKTCFIVDDICDGGKTFIEIAKKLREKNAKEIKLFVSHGIFSKGINVFDGLIDEIVTTNSIDNSIRTGTMEEKIKNNLGRIWAVPFRKEHLYA